MTIDPQKYIVLKRDDYDRITGIMDEPDVLDPVYYEIRDQVGAVELHDAVVIRLQDVFAGPALHTYASTIQSVLSILRQNGTGVSAEQIDHLSELADYFASQADEADKFASQRLPD